MAVFYCFLLSDLKSGVFLSPTRTSLGGQATLPALRRSAATFRGQLTRTSGWRLAFKIPNYVSEEGVGGKDPSPENFTQSGCKARPLGTSQSFPAGPHPCSDRPREEIHANGNWQVFILQGWGKETSSPGRLGVHNKDRKPFVHVLDVSPVKNK